MATRVPDKNQNDLFAQYQTADKRVRQKVRFLLPDIKNSIALSYENMILIAIVFTMSCIITFSLGVEKGRHDAETKIEIKDDSKKNTAPIKKGGTSNVTTPKSKNVRVR